jgi:ABC-type transport system involved in multi-copper enzyme maturation permease subunit
MHAAGIAHVLEVQAGYTVAFLAVALARFTRADVLS